MFVILSGGPGQPGVPFLDRAREWLGPVAAKVRLVAIDQRGTGADALRCPALQGEMGASDLTPPTRARGHRLRARARAEDRRFFSTADTVADIEALRIALNADKLTLDGTSYGTYTAQRYALAHPDRVRGLVLDSVVPVENVSLLSEVPMQGHAANPRRAGDQGRGRGRPDAAQRPRAARPADAAVGRRAARQRRPGRDRAGRRRQRWPAEGAAVRGRRA